MRKLNRLDDMGKYIDVDCLKAEIERLRKEHTTREYRDETALVLEDLWDYADSLQQEQPSLPNDLDEAAEKWCEENNKGIALCDDKKSHYLADGMDAFKAGAEWAMQHKG